MFLDIFVSTTFEQFFFTKSFFHKFSGTSDNEEGLGHGLGLIIDKLKNIETKLDELKTLDQVFTN